MIISRTPYRISFVGGGTDYPDWYRQHGGSVLVTTINKYCYLTCRYLPPFFEHRTSVVWSMVELVKRIEDIKHPSVRETLGFMQIADGLAIHHDGDLPARSGLGSSSAFTVGLLHALHALKGTMPSKMQLARDAIHVEQERLREHVGVQDQIAVAFGGLNRIDFDSNDEFRITPIVMSPSRLDELQAHLMLFYTGISRHASAIAKAQVEAIPQRTQQLKTIQAMVDQAAMLLTSEAELTEFGALLHEAWRVKRSLTDKISTSEIDAAYDTARKAGAIGGKILGAGGGGFLLLCVRPEDQRRVRHALSRLLYVPFRFERSGSQIIFYDADGMAEQRRDGSRSKPSATRAAHRKGRRRVAVSR